MTFLGRGRFDTVLGAVHSVLQEGAALEFSELGPEPPTDPQALMQAYCGELVVLIDRPIEAEILAHLEYPRRVWPATWPRYGSSHYRELILEVLVAAGRRGLTLEFNTTKGGGPDRYLRPGPEVLHWWREVGGKSVSFGVMPMTQARWEPDSIELATWPGERASGRRWLE
jgi:histidinol-phosphatase (PHP family)